MSGSDNIIAVNLILTKLKPGTMKRISCLYLLVSVFLSYQAKAQDLALKTGIIYGKGHVYALTAPDGWVLDNQVGISQGIHAVFYPEGESWENGKCVMYTNFYHYSDTGEITNMDQLITYDLAQIKKHRARTKIKDQANIYTETQGRLAVIKHIYGDLYGNYEAIAYINERYGCVMIIMTARSKKELIKNIQAFEQLLHSYLYISSDINLN